jgi:hypothetical protein
MRGADQQQNHIFSYLSPEEPSPPTTCGVVPLGKKDEVDCTSKAEFDALVRQYYNLDK